MSPGVSAISGEDRRLRLPVTARPKLSAGWTTFDFAVKETWVCARSLPLTVAADPNEIDFLLRTLPVMVLLIPRTALPPTTQNTLDAKAPFLRRTLVLAPVVKSPLIWKIHTAEDTFFASRVSEPPADVVKSFVFEQYVPAESVIPDKSRLVSLFSQVVYIPVWISVSNSLEQALESADFAMMAPRLRIKLLDMTVPGDTPTNPREILVLSVPDVIDDPASTVKFLHELSMLKPAPPLS